MASTLRWDRKIWVRALTMCLLGCCLGSGMGMTDDALEKELQRQYQTFSPVSIAPGTAFVGKAVQFVEHLLKTEKLDESLGKKMALLIMKGAGVGGISERPATEAERRILFGAVSEASKVLGPVASYDAFAHPLYTPDPTPLLRHQAYVVVLKNALPKNYTDVLYEDINREVQARYIVENKTWKGLNPLISETFQKFITSSETPALKQTQILVLKSLLRVQNDQERRKLETLVERLNAAKMYTDSCLREAFFHLIRLHAQSSQQAEVFVQRIEELRKDRGQKTSRLGCALESLGVLQHFPDPETIDLIASLCVLPEDQWDALVQKAQTFKNQCYLDDKGMAHLIRLLSQMPQSLHARLLELAPKIYPYGGKVLDLFVDMDPKSLGPFYEGLESLLRKGVTGYHLKDLKSFLPAERQAFVDQASVLLENLSFDKGGHFFSDLFKRFEAFERDSERQGFVNQVLIFLHFPDMKKEAFFDVWDLAYKVPAQERGSFLEPLAPIILDFNGEQRRQVLTWTQRVQVNNLVPFVRFLVDHQVRDMDHIDQLSQLHTPADWLPRLQNLQNLRGSWRYTISEVSVTQVYHQLDRHPVRINRESLKQWKLPEISTPAYTASKMLHSWQTLWKSLNLTDPSRPDYLSVSLVKEELSTGNDADNSPTFMTSILPKLSGFLKTLWNVPLSGEETDGWQMYDEQKPALQQAFSYILAHMNQADSETKMMQFVQVANGLLHCPTGQKETVDSVVQSLLNQNLVNAETFQQKFEQFLALKKHEAFRQAIVPGQNAQNVHILSFYHEKLRDILGLSSALGQYQERIGIIGQDPFGGYQGNALQAFYNRLTPAYLSHLLYSHTQTKEDFALREAIDKMSQDISQERNPGEKERLKSKRAEWKRQHQRIVKVDRPFHPMDIYQDLVRRGKLSDPESNEWQRYFSDDPLLSTESFELTQAGAHQYLVDVEILVVKPANS